MLNRLNAGTRYSGLAVDWKCSGCPHVGVTACAGPALATAREASASWASRSAVGAGDALTVCPRPGWATRRGPTAAPDAPLGHPTVLAVGPAPSAPDFTGTPNTSAAASAERSCAPTGRPLSPRLRDGAGPAPRGWPGRSVSVPARRSSACRTSAPWRVGRRSVLSGTLVAAVSADGSPGTPAWTVLLVEVGLGGCQWSLPFELSGLVGSGCPGRGGCGFQWSAAGVVPFDSPPASPGRTRPLIKSCEPIAV